MATINYTADDGSVVVFVDPAGVQAAVDAAIAALPVPAPVEGEVIKDEIVENVDGTTETLEPVTVDVTPAV
jgi:hydrogenase maturation factor